MAIQTYHFTKILITRSLNKNFIIIVDDADIPMLDSPSEFKEIIVESPCICFTAIPALSVMVKKVAELLKFS